MIVNIRGALGTQVLELMVGLIKAQQAGETVEEIHVNTGGRTVPTTKREYITDLFDINTPVKVVPGKTKQNAWTLKNFELLLDIDAHQLLPLKNTVSETKEHLIHVRGLDRQTASADDYKKIKNNTSLFIGDDKQLIETITGQPHTMNSPFDDWMRCVNCESLISSFSSFTVSAMMYDTDKNFKVLTRENSHGPQSVGSAEYQCINLLLENKFTHAGWI